MERRGELGQELYELGLRLGRLGAVAVGSGGVAVKCPSPSGTRDTSSPKRSMTTPASRFSHRSRRGQGRPGRVKTMNESIFYNVDRLHGAIAANRVITFRYFEYNAARERVFRRAGDKYRATPFGLVWDSENYYLAGRCPSRRSGPAWPARPAPAPGAAPCRHTGSFARRTGPTGPARPAYPAG